MHALGTQHLFKRQTEGKMKTFLDTFLTLASIPSRLKVLCLENRIGWALLGFNYIQIPEVPSEDEVVKF